MRKIINFFGKDAEEKECIEEQFKKICADGYFVQFVLEWYGWKPKILFVGKISESYKKRIKRSLQAAKVYDNKKWKEVYLKDLRDLKNRKLIRTLFKQTFLSPRPSNRPKDIEKLKIVHILRLYLKELTGKLQMELIAGILGIESDSLAQEWSRRRNEALPSDYMDMNSRLIIPFSPEGEYKKLKKFYSANKERVVEALKTGTPVWLQFPRTNEKPKGVRSKMGKKKESEPIGRDDDHVVQLIAKEDLDIQGTHYKEGEHFILEPKIFWKVFDKKVMEKVRVIPKIQCLKCGNRFVLEDTQSIRCPQCGAKEDSLEPSPRSLYLQPEIWV